jgi:hypothetical protein
LNEQVMQENSEVASQKREKRRSRSDKVGKYKYNQQLLKRCLRGIEEIKGELRWVRHRLDRIGEAEYTVPDVAAFALQDAVDRDIVQRVREAGAPGVFPKDVAADLNRRGGFGLRYYDVSRRCARMNKKLRFETGKLLFEKRGHRWALTSFGFDVWGSAEEVVE